MEQTNQETRNLRAVELDKVLRLLAEQASSEEAAARALELLPA